MATTSCRVARNLPKHALFLTTRAHNISCLTLCPFCIITSTMELDSLTATSHHLFVQEARGNPLPSNPILQRAGGQTNSGPLHNRQASESSWKGGGVGGVRGWGPNIQAARARLGSSAKYDVPVPIPVGSCGHVPATSLHLDPGCHAPVHAAVSHAFTSHAGPMQAVHEGTWTPASSARVRSRGHS